MAKVESKPEKRLLFNKNPGYFPDLPRCSKFQANSLFLSKWPPCYGKLKIITTSNFNLHINECP